MRLEPRATVALIQRVGWAAYVLVAVVPKKKVALALLVSAMEEYEEQPSHRNSPQVHRATKCDLVLLWWAP